MREASANDATMTRRQTFYGNFRGTIAKVASLVPVSHDQSVAAEPGSRTLRTTSA